MSRSEDTRAVAAKQPGDPISPDKQETLFRARLGLWAGSPSVIILGGILGTLLMLMLCAATVQQSRDNALTLAREQSHNFGLLVERDIAHNFELYKLSLQAAVEGYANPALMALPASQIRKIVFDRFLDVRYIHSTLIANQRGEIELDSRNRLVNARYIGDQPFFSVHRDDPDAGMFLSGPVAGITDPTQRVMVVSERLNNAEGVFAGVVMIEISLDYFKDLLSVVKLGPHAAVTLMLENGIVLMRKPARPQDIGSSIAAFKNFKRIRDADETSFFSSSTMDGVKRLVVSKHVEGLPIYVIFAPSEADIYSESWDRSKWIALLAVVFSTGLLCMSYFLAQQMRYRTRAEKDLLLLARTDGLTGLSNRRSLDEALQHEWRRAERHHAHLALLFIDIDFFKLYNDTYGHQAGDDILSQIAVTISHSARRPGDIAARYGGEEFMLILPQTGVAGAHLHAGNIRNAVNELRLPHSGGLNGHVTVSIGMAAFPVRKLQSVDQLVEAADRALYRAKASGRDRIEVATMSEVVPVK